MATVIPGRTGQGDRSGSGRGSDKGAFKGKGASGRSAAWVRAVLDRPMTSYQLVLAAVRRWRPDALHVQHGIATYGPRLAPQTPTIFMGTRGALNFDLVVDLREGGHHSGNWGGLLANPGVLLCHAIASIIDGTPGALADRCPVLSASARNF